ncbi:MAG: hypothetical protein IT384_07070 [Deltaproteobacteria bacterium]|nr:hypothetical protein [Deltaproteobacteria bacterium]
MARTLNMPSSRCRAALGMITTLTWTAALGAACQNRQADTPCGQIKELCAAPASAHAQETCDLLAEHPQAGTEAACRDGLRRIALGPARPLASPEGCHPSYEGACLRPGAGDYDCAGGSGDGPNFTGPVRVVGPDEFELDGDRDGDGCER